MANSGLSLLSYYADYAYIFCLSCFETYEHLPNTTSTVNNAYTFVILKFVTQIVFCPSYY